MGHQLGRDQSQYIAQPLGCSQPPRTAQPTPERPAPTASQAGLICYACKLGLEGIVSKRLGSLYRSGRSRDWIKLTKPNAPAVKREAEEDWRR
jgi:hypothetical protein